MYRIVGAIPAANYIQLPKTSSQSLSLTGQYLYTIFKPLSGKYFVFHLEAVNSSGMVVRLSFSNLFKEFKSTATWLQFPLVAYQDKENKCGQWILLKINLRDLLSKYLHTKYCYLKNIKICANLLVKNVLVSEFNYTPDTPGSLPKEISLPLAKDEVFSDKYLYLQFPSEGSQSVHHKTPARKLQGSIPTTNIVGAKREREGKKVKVWTDYCIMYIYINVFVNSSECPSLTVHCYHTNLAPPNNPLGLLYHIQSVLTSGPSIILVLGDNNRKKRFMSTPVGRV